MRGTAQSSAVGQAFLSDQSVQDSIHLTALKASLYKGLPLVLCYEHMYVLHVL